MRDWPDHEFLHAHGFEEAFIGVVYGKGKNPVTCYDRGVCISVLMAGDDEMTEEEAEEYFSFNVDNGPRGFRRKAPMFLVTTPCPYFA